MNAYPQQGERYPQVISLPPKPPLGVLGRPGEIVATRWSLGYYYECPQKGIKLTLRFGSTVAPLWLSWWGRG